MVRQRRTVKKEEQKQEQGEEEKGGVREERTISRRNMLSMVIGLMGAALTVGAYSQTFVSPTQSVAAGLFVLFFGLLVSEGFVSL